MNADLQSDPQNDAPDQDYHTQDKNTKDTRVFLPLICCMWWCLQSCWYWLHREEVESSACTRVCNWCSWWCVKGWLGAGTATI